MQASKIILCEEGTSNNELLFDVAKKLLHKLKSHSLLEKKGHAGFQRQFMCGFEMTTWFMEMEFR